MTVIRRKDLKLDESMPNLKRLTLINDQTGAGYLTFGELTIAPGKSVPLHTHPTHEEGMYVMDGDLEFILGDEKGVLGKGDAMLAPAGVKHQLTNRSPEPRRVMFIFPTTNVKRQVLEG
ncbi:MAG: cupin domain-containing protein [SAR202 cluster bacterium]|nr:cupin domain-containing protein [SAR202 cluster bacterium]